MPGLSTSRALLAEGDWLGCSALLRYRSRGFVACMKCVPRPKAFALKLEALACAQVLCETEGLAHYPGGPMTTIFPFPGLKNRSEGFVPRLIEVAAELQTDPNFLLAVMQRESGISPSIVNPISRATGLIQFMPKTALTHGTTVEALKNMSDVEQLDYVLSYYRDATGRIRSAGDAYIWTFMPAFMGRPDSAVIARAGQKVYDQNKVLDANKDGILTAGEVRYLAEKTYRQYAGLPPLSLNQIAPPASTRSGGKLLGWALVLGSAAGLFVLTLKSK